MLFDVGTSIAELENFTTLAATSEIIQLFYKTDPLESASFVFALHFWRCGFRQTASTVWTKNSHFGFKEMLRSFHPSLKGRPVPSVPANWATLETSWDEPRLGLKGPGSKLEVEIFFVKHAQARPKCVKGWPINHKGSSSLSERFKEILILWGQGWK